MHVRQSFITIGLLVLFLPLSSWAAASRTVSAKFNHSVLIAGITLPAGRYEFHLTPDTSVVTILRQSTEISYPWPGQGYTWESHMRLIGSVCGEWIQLASKARKTDVVANDSRVWQIEFRGEKKAIRFFSGTGTPSQAR